MANVAPDALATRVMQLCILYLRAPSGFLTDNATGLPVLTFNPVLSAPEQTTYNSLLAMAQFEAGQTLAQWQAGTWTPPANSPVGKLAPNLNSDGTVKAAAIQGAVNTIAPPLVHTHVETDVTNLTGDLAAKALSVHTHTEANVTSLVTDLAAKAASVHTHAEADTTNLVTDLAAKAATGHTHTEANVTNLVTDLAAKAASVHTHVESDTTNLVTDLAGKAPTVHTHPPTFATLANGATAMAFGTNTAVKVTPNLAATYTTTVPVAGTEVFLIVLTSGVTSFVITFGTGFKPTATLATGTTTARVFVLTWISDGTNLYEVSRTVAMVA